MSGSISILARSQIKNRVEFSDLFSKAPEAFRKDPYRVSLPPAPLWNTFLDFPFPKPIEFWVATIEGRTVGRIGANISEGYPEKGYVGFFEADTTHPSFSEISKRLLNTACNWLKSQEAKEIYGPICLNTWFPYRFRTNDDGVRRFLWEPVNPPEYVQAFKDHRFKECETYVSSGFDDLESYLEGTRAGYDAALSKNYSFRVFDQARLLDRELPILYEISMKSFSKAFLFEPIPFDAFKLLYVPFLSRFNASLSYFLLNPDGKEVGYFFCYEDQGFAVMKSIAILDEARGGGLSNGLVHMSSLAAKNQGITKFITALVRSDAQSQSFNKKCQLRWTHEYSLYRLDSI